VLEDVAVEFKMKMQQKIDRIQELQTNGTIIGVIDGRVKFIYVSKDELVAISKFIKQRGRVSIAELVEGGNNLINLMPVAGSQLILVLQNCNLVFRSFRRYSCYTKIFFRFFLLHSFMAWIFENITLKGFFEFRNTLAAIAILVERCFW